MEQFKPFDAAKYLKEKLGMQPEQPEQEQKEAVESMTIGRMEEFKDFINNVGMEAFLGRREGNYEEKERIQKGRELIKEFLSAKDGLDSNSKEKLYGHILEENWKPKLEKVFNKISKELKELDIIKSKKAFKDLSEEEKKIFAVLPESTTKTGLTRLIDGELKKLEEFGFDEQRLNGLKEQLKILKKPVKKPKI